MGKKTLEIVCFCNNIPRKNIEDAIKNGAKTLNEIYDTTCAGVGPCGGSCRRKIGPLLDHYLSTGEFPKTIEPDMTGKPKKAPHG